MRIARIIALIIACGTALADDSIVVSAFGDSLSAGYGLPENKGFAPALQTALSQLNVSAKVINAGVSGETSADGLARVDWMLRKKPDIVIVEFGANDMFRGTPISETEKNLSEIVARIQKTGVRVLLVGMEPPANYNVVHRLRYSYMYSSIADDYDVPLYPFFLEGVALNPALNLSDGIHPNATGTAIVARNIAPLVADIAKEL